MADLILANPAMDQNELARHFGYTAGWVSQVIASDAFQAYLATRKEEIIDPVLRGAVEESFRGLVLQSVALLRKKLDANPSDELVLEVFKNSAKALGYGARPTVSVNQTNIQNNSLIQVLKDLPPPSQTQPFVVDGSPPSTPPLSKAEAVDAELALLEAPAPA